MYSIEMIAFTDDYMPQQEGKYLVETESNVLQTRNWLPAYVTIQKKFGKDVCKVHVSNQKVISISTKPLI